MGEKQVEEFVGRDLSGARFRRVDLSGATLRDVDLSGVRIIGGYASELDFDGDVDRLVVNGVDVMPYVWQELKALHPGLELLEPAGAAGFREAWAMLESQWAQTVERARRLPPELLHESVDEEWSFIETLRHLVFATDAWIRRAYLGEPSPYHPLGLPHDDMDDTPGVPRDRSARPSLEEILAVRADRMASVRSVYDDLTDEALAGRTEPVTAPGYPASESYEVRRCLQCILNEEFWHRVFAERDLAVLESRLGG